jgi:hypothetical protein
MKGLGRSWTQSLKGAVCMSNLTHEKDSLILLVRWLSKAVMDQHDAWHRAIVLPPEDCKEYLIMKFPMVQTTKLQMTLKKVGLGVEDLNADQLNEALEMVKKAAGVGL